jgi:hypothetical protein
MRKDEQRAKWQRNAAIFGDIARLGAQAYAVDGGSTKVEKFTPQTQIANERLAAIRDRNAAQIEAFAQSMAAARNADAADNKARMKAEMDYAQADAAARYKAAKDAADMQYKIHRDAMSDKQHAEKLAQQAKLHKEKLKSQEGIAVTRAGNRTGNAAYDALYDEYQEMRAKYPEYTVMKKVMKRDKLGFLEKDKEGKQKYENVEELNPTINQVRNALATWRANPPQKAGGDVGAGVLLEQESGEKKAGFSSGNKKAGFK